MKKQKTVEESELLSGCFEEQSVVEANEDYNLIPEVSSIFRRRHGIKN